ncbi:hypothetical protein NLG97_g5354 [Lecanicillium saksenae]|uniref:Uncharacterized protein n=1 Tax=Lecanicillium saksenae TaxID=468837 RepID=A0ACC1QUF5_9HYPO|nr:hypothetical protein NLG97_g5354 [Lecanicillium saksenae]
MNTTHRVRVAQLPDITLLCLRQAHKQTKPPNRLAFKGPEGHGENIWVFAHRRTDQVIYSFNAQLDGYHDLKQLPYNGKKTKPAKLRKDYWAPMAKIEFPSGSGDIGRTVFQKLRELRHRHEVSWNDTMLYKKPIEYTTAERRIAAKRLADKQPEPRFMRNRLERGKAINAQKANSIADMAAVLAGKGPGNTLASEKPSGGKKLVKVTVNWANVLDAGFARSWSQNVTHTELVEPVKEVVEDATLPAEAEAAA